MGEIYYDPYTVYECIYCKYPTPNDNYICDTCNNRFCYFSLTKIYEWFINLFIY